MTMILKRSLVRLGPWAWAFAMILVADVWAQAPAAGFSSAGATDMRLWSFGDCDRRYPYVNTAERKECVRVVGSVEAKDARAYRMCEVSQGRILLLSHDALPYFAPGAGSGAAAQ